eukprot:7619800-Heterocapsa_arctica.AAC.1
MHQAVLAQSLSGCKRTLSSPEAPCARPRFSRVQQPGAAHGRAPIAVPCVLRRQTQVMTKKSSKD